MNRNMVYMGSKSRIAKHIVPIIQSYLDYYKPLAYIEPFVGGANVIDKIKYNVRIGTDANKYLIALLRHVQSGGDLPEMITEEEYIDARDNKDKHEPWYIGCVGFLASFRGKFFDNYAGIVFTEGGKKNRNYYKEHKQNLIKQAAAFHNIDFYCCDYRDLSDITDCVIYCDPPYVDKRGYKKKINSAEFWNVMRDLSEKNIVLISEEKAPEDFRVIWQGDIKHIIGNTTKNQSIKVTEKLFIYKGETK